MLLWKRLFVLTRDGPYILEIKKPCSVVLSPEMRLMPHFPAAGGLQHLGSKASAVTSTLALHG